jgi:tryptophan 2,3-dioxygenase
VCSAGALHTARRIAKILKTVVGQLDILETMTPRQFASFRDALGTSSGFQSAQFRELEAVLGRRSFPASDLRDDARLQAAVGRRSLFDSLLRYLDGHGYAIPEAALGRDPAAPWSPDEGVQRVLREVYSDESRPAAEVCESLVDVDEGVQEWRYRHLKMVERTIGAKLGTGGSAGADYLRSTLFTPAFPDLWEVRSQIEETPAHGT